MTGLIVDFPQHLRQSTFASHINKVEKRVNFSPTSELCYFDSGVDNFLDRREIWYAEQDYKDFRAQNKEAVCEYQLKAIVLSSSQQDSAIDVQAFLEDVVTTGIENVLTPKLVKKSKLRRVLCCDAVFDEQERQDACGEYDPVKLASKSMYYSSWSAKRAAKIGLLQSQL